MPTTQTAGFKVLVHDQAEPPQTIATQGISVPPGYRTSIVLTRKQYKNLPEPYPYPCTDTKKLENYGTYTKTGCLHECAEKHVIKECGCRFVEFQTPAPYCVNGTLEKQAKNVHYEFIRDFINQCDCPEACETTKYEQSVSYSMFPSIAFMDSILAHEAIRGQNITDRQGMIERMRANILSLNIYFKDLNYIKAELEPLYDFGDILSTIGGQLGLFLGASILTMMEFIELFINLVIWKLKH